MPTSKKQEQERLIVRLENIRKFIKKHLGQYWVYERSFGLFNELIKFERNELRLMNKKE